MSGVVIHAEGLGKSYRRDAENTLPLNLSGRIPELDGIRGIAIAMVLFHHFLVVQLVLQPATLLSYAMVPFRLGWSGVDLFFVLSGFLIGGILLDAREASNYFQVFYARRFFRIVPIYMVVLAGFFVLAGVSRLGWAKNFSWMIQDHMPWYSYLLFLRNFWMTQRNSLGIGELSMTWTLAVEEQFYLTLPVVIWICARGRLLASILTALIAAPIFRMLLFKFWNTHFLSWSVLMPCRADALLLGVVGAVVLRDPRCRSWLQENRWIHLGVLFTFAAGFVYLDLRAYASRMFLMVSLGYTWLGMFYLCGLLYALLHRESILSQCLRWRWLIWTGTIAYGLYLLHGVVFSLFASIVWAGPPKIENFGGLAVSMSALIASLVIARLSWAHFERPLVEIGHRFKYEGIRERPTKTFAATLGQN